jgi:hypothetical protein
MLVGPIQKAAAATLPQRSLPVLLGHCRNTVVDSFTSGASNLKVLRRNAMMLSGAIQIASRILVANATAAKTRGTPEGYYRFQEAANTTFREIFAWCATYVLLLYAQRLIVDFFRSLLWVRGGVPFRPTMFQGAFQRLFGVPDAIRRDLAKKFAHEGPGFFSKMGGHVRDFAQAAQKPLPKFPKLPPLVERGTEFLDVDLLRRRQQYRSIEPLVNGICRLAGQNPSNMIPSKKVQVFFDWAPPVLGSIPAILISGYGSESLTQRYARRFAAKVSQVAGGKEGAQPALSKKTTLPGLEDAVEPYEPTVAFSSPATPAARLAQSNWQMPQYNYYASPFLASAPSYWGANSGMWSSAMGQGQPYPYQASPWGA